MILCSTPLPSRWVGALRGTVGSGRRRETERKRSRGEGLRGGADTTSTSWPRSFSRLAYVAMTRKPPLRSAMAQTNVIRIRERAPRGYDWSNGDTLGADGCPGGMSAGFYRGIKRRGNETD